MVQFSGSGIKEVEGNTGICSLQYTCNCLCNLYHDKTSSTFLTIFNRNFINFELFTFHEACSHCFQLTRAILYYIDTPLLDLKSHVEMFGVFSLRLQPYSI